MVYRGIWVELSPGYNNRLGGNLFILKFLTFTLILCVPCQVLHLVSETHDIFYCMYIHFFAGPIQRIKKSYVDDPLIPVPRRTRLRIQKRALQQYGPPTSVGISVAEHSLSTTPVTDIPAESESAEDFSSPPAQNAAPNISASTIVTKVQENNQDGSSTNSDSEYESENLYV